jgi:acetylornithine deacetylase
MTLQPVSKTLTLDLIDRLVGFDTTSRHSNLDLIAWVEGFLDARGIQHERVASDDGAKTNLFATLGAPGAAGAVVLSGHSDVVPVDGQPWTSDPWVVTRRGTRLYGRGVADMKSFLALSLAAMDAWAKSPPARPVHLAVSYDEEVGCLGVPRLVEAIAPRLGADTAVLIGEPTLWRTVSAHKSISTFIVEVIGREAHSSRPQDGANAIMAALPLMQLIGEMAAEAASGAGEEAGLFDPPGATMGVGMIDGGTAINILARRCVFQWDLRCPPGIDPDIYISRFRTAAAAINATLKAVDPACGVTITQRSATPALAEDRNGPAERLIRGITGDNERRAVGFATEGGVFQRSGLSAVVCGPGSIEQAHQPDEWIEEYQIAAGCAFMDKLGAVLSA